jgi:hypothetical protein
MSGVAFGGLDARPNPEWALIVGVRTSRGGRGERQPMGFPVIRIAAPSVRQTTLAKADGGEAHLLNRRWWSALLCVLTLSLLGACADDGRQPDTQPAPEVNTFSAGDFDDLPLPAGAKRAGERSERDGVVTQSFFVPNTSPEQVLEFYASVFDEQNIPVIDEPAPAGTTAWRGRWLIEDRQLLVSATTAPSAQGDDERVTQFSLELSPPGDGQHGSDDADGGE